MKRKATKPAVPEPSGRAKRKPPGTTLSRKLRDKKDRQTSATGGSSPDPAGVQKHGHCSILHYLYRNTLGQRLLSQMRQCLQQPFVRSLSSYHIHGSASPFDRRITCLEWHPTHSSTLAVGSKGGDIYLWDVESSAKSTFSRGNGPGDFIGGMKFCPHNFSRVYVASGEGTLGMYDLEGGTRQILSRTFDCGHDHHNVCSWFCCLDVSVSRRMLVTGDNLGHLLLLGLDGKKVFNGKLHKAKVTHAEFNTRCDWLLATASVDHTVKLWDLRQVKDKSSFLHFLPHEKAVNSAYFNPSDSSKLLTTDQYDQIRVYASSDWSKPRHVIRHPHRQFQHLTPIKATWHPVYDLVVAGRYPDDRVCPGDRRTVDVYDSGTAELLFQLQDATASGIKSVNKFNPAGDMIGTGMGVTALVWGRNKSWVVDRQGAPETIPTGASPLAGRSRPGRERRGRLSDLKLKKKLASLEEPATKTKAHCEKKRRKRE